MTAVLMTPPYIQFFDSDGVTPLSGGKVYTYTSTGGTFATAKATYTTAAGSVEAANPVILNSRGIPTSGNGNLWLSGTYDFKITDADDVQVGQQLAVTAFTTLASSSTAYFQSFSGTGAQTAFTTSTDLGTDEKAIFVWVDAGAGKGYEIYAPTAYTISGTTLTFSVAPASGTNNIYVSAPSTLVGAASSAAADAAASAAAALASETAAATAQTNAETAETNAETAATNAQTAETNAETAETNAETAATLSQDWATKTNGQVAATDYSAKAWAIGGTGTTTNNAKYYSEQAAAIVFGDILNMDEQASSASTPAAGYSKLYFKTDHILYSIDENGTERAIVGDGVPLQTQNASNSAAINFTSNINSTYNLYRLQFTNITVQTDGVDLLLRVSTDGGSSYISGAGAYRYSWQGADEGSSTAGTATNTSILLNDSTTGIGNAAAESISGEIFLAKPSSTATYCIIYGRYAFSTINGQTSHGHIEGYYATAGSAINAISLFASSGNLVAGEFKLSGL